MSPKHWKTSEWISRIPPRAHLADWFGFSWANDDNFSFWLFILVARLATGLAARSDSTCLWVASIGPIDRYHLFGKLNDSCLPETSERKKNSSKLRERENPSQVESRAQMEQRTRRDVGLAYLLHSVSFTTSQLSWGRLGETRRERRNI